MDDVFEVVMEGIYFDNFTGIKKPYTIQIAKSRIRFAPSIHEEFWGSEDIEHPCYYVLFIEMIKGKRVVTRAEDACYTISHAIEQAEEMTEQSVQWTHLHTEE